MRVLILFIATLAMSSLALAQTGTVRKVKGRSAIIKFDQKPDFEKGDKVSIGGETSASRPMGGASSRNYSLTLAGAIQSTTVDTGPLGETEVDGITLATLFMVNREIFEFGGGLTYVSLKSGSSESTEYSLIGVGEYNIIPNRPGTMFVPSVQGSIGISNYEQTGGASASGNGLLFGFGARLKAFPWNDSFALTAEFGITSSTVDIGGGIERKTDSSGLTFGVQGYF